MANARQQQLELQQQRSASSRYSSMRGRTLAGYGGNLAGYGVSLEKTNAEKEDQLMNKKFTNGEVSLDDYLIYLNKAQTRTWLNTEDRKLLLQNIRELTDDKNDEVMYAKYTAKQISAKDYANYKRSVLQRMNPNSPKFSTTQSEIATLDRNGNIEELTKKYNQEMSQISGIASESERDSKTADLYANLANEAKMKGLTDEAVAYEQNANQYRVKAQVSKAEDEKNLKTNSKTSLVNNINLTVNDYIDNKITPEQFMGQLDTFEREAIKNGNTELLNDLNQWVNSTREDIKYGKAWDRGGDRRGKTGSGEGGSGSGELTLNGGNINTKNNPLAKDFIGPPEAKQYPDTIDGQTEKYRDMVTKAQQDLADGNITQQDYFNKIKDFTKSRNADIETWKSQLVGKKNTYKVKTGTDTKTAETVLKEFDVEQNDNWGAPLGMTKAEAGSAGINDISKALEAESKNGYKNLVVELQTSGLLGGDVKAGIVKKGEILSSDYIDTPMGRLKVQSTKDVQTITNDEWNALPDEERNKFTPDPQTGMFVNTKNQSRYVDIPDSSGRTVRYILDSENKIKEIVDSEGTKYQGDYTGDQFIPQTQIEKLNKINQEEAIKAQKSVSILPGVEADTGRIPGVNETKIKQEVIPTQIFNPTTKTVEPVAQIQPGLKLNTIPQETINVVKPQVAPVGMAQPSQAPQELRLATPSVNINQPTKPISDKLNSNLAPNMLLPSSISSQTLKKPTTPQVYTPTTKVSDNTIKMTNSLNKQLEQQKKPSLLSKATSWVTGLFKR